MSLPSLTLLHFFLWWTRQSQTSWKCVHFHRDRSGRVATFFLCTVGFRMDFYFYVFCKFEFFKKQNLDSSIIRNKAVLFGHTACIVINRYWVRIFWFRDPWCIFFLFLGEVLRWNSTCETKPKCPFPATSWSEELPLTASVSSDCRHHFRILTWHFPLLGVFLCAVSFLH